MHPLLVFCKFLNPAKIPKLDGPFNAHIRKTVRTALQCLRGLAATEIHFSKKWESLVDHLIMIWPTIWRWLQYLYWQFMVTPNVAEKPFPLLALTSISEIITSHSKDLRLRTFIVELPAFFHLLVNCWSREAQDPSLNTGTPITGALVRCSTEVLKKTPHRSCALS